MHCYRVVKNDWPSLFERLQDNRGSGRKDRPDSFDFLTDNTPEFFDAPSSNSKHVAVFARDPMDLFDFGNRCEVRGFVLPARGGLDKNKRDYRLLHIKLRSAILNVYSAYTSARMPSFLCVPALRRLFISRVFRIEPSRFIPSSIDLGSAIVKLSR